MKRISTWFWIFSKRYLKRVSFVFVLIILPIIAFVSNKTVQEEEAGVRIGLYSEDSEMGTMGMQMISELLAYDGYLTFYDCESEEQLIIDVKTRKAECGYLFPADMEAYIIKGKVQELIKVYSSPSTILDKMSSEVVFSTFMKINSENVLRDFADTTEIFNEMNRQEAKAEILDSYNQYIANGSTFQFEYKFQNIPSENADFKEVSIFPIRGIIAVYIFAIGLFSAVNWFQDKELGIFGLQSYTFEPWGNMIAIGTPVIWAGISGIVAIFFSGDVKAWYFEIIIIALYTLAIIVFSDLLRSCFKNAISLCSIVPIMIIGCFVFCPIFVDLKGIFKPLGIMEKLFLPYYYLNSFTSNHIRGGIAMGLVGLVLVGISFIRYRFRE